MLIAAGALLAMFFFMTLYMQLANGWSPLHTGLAYLPFEAAVVIFSGLAALALKRLPIWGLVSAGTLAAAGGFLLLSGLELHASYTGELLPGMLITAAGLGLAFVPLTTAATSGIRARDTGLASGLLSTAQQVGGAIGIAVLVTVASTHTSSLEALNQRTDRRCAG
jgi:Major Facilitator Superfamily